MEDFLTFGYFGEDVSDPVSTQVINTFFDELKVNAVYIPFQAGDNEFITALPVLRTKFNGFNLSPGYELQIPDHLDKIDKTAKDIGAVSTAKVGDGKITGYNTDRYGFERSLAGFLEDPPSGKQVLIIGADGPAYAAAETMLKYGASITVLSDDKVKAHMLKVKMGLSYDGKKIITTESIKESDELFMIVNTNQNSDRNRYIEQIPEEVYKKSKYAYDFNFGISPFLKKASDAGANIKDGFDMMFFKAIETIKIWLDKEEIADDTILKIYNMVRAQNITA